MKKLLIVYYSWSHGNTERVARILSEVTGATLLRIDTEVPYEGSFEEVVELAKKDVRNKKKPKLKPVDIKLNEYDAIAIGTPTWWYTMAPAVRSFLCHNDLSGKTLIPFMTNGGWPGHVIKDIIALSKGTTSICPMEVAFDSDGGDQLQTEESEIKSWAEKVRLALMD